MSSPTMFTLVCKHSPSSMGKIHLWVTQPFDLTLIICQHMEHWGSTTEVGHLSRAPKYLYMLLLNVNQPPSDPQFSFASLPGNSRNRLLRREGDLGADRGMAGDAMVTVIFYPYQIRFLVVTGNSHAREQKKSCIFTFTARAFLSSCATLRVTSVPSGADSDQVAWGLFKAEHS